MADHHITLILPLSFTRSQISLTRIMTQIMYNGNDESQDALKYS